MPIKRGVIRKLSAPPALTDLIAVQAGVFSMGQAIDAGASREFVRRMVRDERYHRISEGLYSTLAEPSWLGWAWGGLLIGGQHATLGGRAAGHLWGLWNDKPQTIDVWARRPSRRADGRWRFHRGVRAGRLEPSRLPAARALIDVLSEAEPSEVEGLLLDALRTRKVSAKKVREALQETPRLRHRALMVQVIDVAGAGAESALESRYLRDVEQAHSLPSAERQSSVSSGTRSDVLYADFGVVVELDGRLGHEGSGAFRDAERDNAHSLAGYLTLRFGWRDVTRGPCSVAVTVREALAARGWSGDSGRCRRCA